MDYSGIHKYKPDFQCLKLGDNLSSDMVFHESVETNSIDERPNDNTCTPKGFSIVLDVDGKVVCPDKL